MAIDLNSNEEMVVCSGANKCTGLVGCKHRTPHARDTWCDETCTAAGGVSKCIPVQFPTEKPKSYILFIEAHPDEQNFAIQAGSELEAYKKALETLGWGLK